MQDCGFLTHVRLFLRPRVNRGFLGPTLLLNVETQLGNLLSDGCAPAMEPSSLLSPCLSSDNHDRDPTQSRPYAGSVCKPALDRSIANDSTTLRGRERVPARCSQSERMCSRVSDHRGDPRREISGEGYAFAESGHEIGGRTRWESWFESIMRP